MWDVDCVQFIDRVSRVTIPLSAANKESLQILRIHHNAFIPINSDFRAAFIQFLSAERHTHGKQNPLRSAL